MTSAAGRNHARRPAPTQADRRPHAALSRCGVPPRSTRHHDQRSTTAAPSRGGPLRRPRHRPRAPTLYVAGSAPTRHHRPSTGSCDSLLPGTSYVGDRHIVRRRHRGRSGPETRPVEHRKSIWRDDSPGRREQLAGPARTVEQRAGQAVGDRHPPCRTGTSRSCSGRRHQRGKCCSRCTIAQRLLWPSPPALPAKQGNAAPHVLPADDGPPHVQRCCPSPRAPAHGHPLARLLAATPER